MRPGPSLPVLALAAALAGCAVPSGGGSPFADPAMTVQAASAAVAPGAGKADLLARLGPAEVIRFDSGYEVWVWRARGGRGAGEEFVVLLDPSGRVVKTRQRAAPGPAAQAGAF